MTALDPLEDGRQEFETFMRKEMPAFDLTHQSRFRENMGDYAALDTEDCWLSWQAAWTARAARERELVKALRALQAIHEQATRRWRANPDQGASTIGNLERDLERIVSLAADAISDIPGAEAALSETQPEEKTK